MKLTKANTRAFKAIGYDADKAIIHVEFNSGAVFEYGSVTPEDWKALNDADSIGSHFAKVIKPTRNAVPIRNAEKKSEVEAPKAEALPSEKMQPCNVNGQLGKNAMCGRVTVNSGLCSSSCKCKHKAAKIDIKAD